MSLRGISLICLPSIITKTNPPIAENSLENPGEQKIMLFMLYVLCSAVDFWKKSGKKKINPPNKITNPEHHTRVALKV